MPSGTSHGFFSSKNWQLKSALRIIFGIVWGIDGAMKFSPGLPDVFPGMVSNAAAGQPAWLAPWFGFWAAQSAINPVFWVYLVGVLELALAFSLIFGFMRKIGYVGGFILSLFIWAVPEGFGGPYGPGSTDIGTGIIYALVFISLMIINAGYGTSKYSLDALIEKRWPAWRKVSEFSWL